MARSVADLRLMLQVISGPDGHDPEVPPVPWRQAGPVELTGLQAAYWPGFLPWSPEGSGPGPRRWPWS
jgi:amidase